LYNLTTEREKERERERKKHSVKLNDVDTSITPFAADMLFSFSNALTRLIFVSSRRKRRKEGP